MKKRVGENIKKNTNHEKPNIPILEPNKIDLVKIYYI